MVCAGCELEGAWCWLTIGKRRDVNIRSKLMECVASGPSRRFLAFLNTTKALKILSELRDSADRPRIIHRFRVQRSPE